MILWEVLQINKEQDIEVRMLGTNSQYKQGIRIAIDFGNRTDREPMYLHSCGYITLEGIEQILYKNHVLGRI